MFAFKSALRGQSLFGLRPVTIECISGAVKLHRAMHNRVISVCTSCLRAALRECMRLLCAMRGEIRARLNTHTPNMYTALTVTGI
jgi:hypothetical protein